MHLRFNRYLRSEGPAKMLSNVSDREEALALYQAVKNSELYDKNLKMLCVY